MDRLILTILLENKGAGPFWIIGIVFNDFGIGKASHNIGYKDVVVGKLVIAMG